MPETTRYQRGKLYQLNISELHPDPNQPRKYFDEAALEELVSSIKSKGVLQPIIFRKDENSQLILVSGERRFKAAQKAELEKIPGIYTDGDPTEISLVENLLRENLTPVEEAEAMDKLIENKKAEHEGYTQEKLSEVLGKSPSTISEILSLTRLPVEIRDEVRNNPKVSRSVLVEIAKRKQERSMKSLWKKYKEKRLSRDELRESTGRQRRERPVIVIDLISGTIDKLDKVNTADWSNEDKERLNAALTNLKQKLEEKFGI